MSRLILALVTFAAISAYEIVQDEQGQAYYLVPTLSLNRQRRQLSNIKIGDANPGTRVTLQHQGNIVNNNGHRVDGGALASKQFRPSGPTTVGGQVGYSHAPSGSSLNLGAQHTQRYGTDVSANGRVNLWSNGNARLDAVGSYGRHYGGMGGSGRPGYYTALEYKMKFHQ